MNNGQSLFLQNADARGKRLSIDCARPLLARCVARDISEGRHLGRPPQVVKHLRDGPKQR